MTIGTITAVNTPATMDDILTVDVATGGEGTPKAVVPYGYNPQVGDLVNVIFTNAGPAVNVAFTGNRG
ncbi:hypothetical protein SAMN05444157_1631 [Frankineae bacterium MT45]|nr:hypothetical protein SAMN05444157_1631 [Frankineae bacterium MT45]